MTPRRHARVLTVPNPPAEQTLALAAAIRRTIGHGGANYPGARELYEAAGKIEVWAAEWEWPTGEAA
jgi:hypothetical protein